MAVAAVTTSGITALTNIPSGYDMAELERMFLFGEPPCTISEIEAVAADAWTSAASVSLLAAPGASRSLFIYGAGAWANNTATPVGSIILAIGAIAAPPVITSSIASIPICGPAQPNSVPFTRICRTITANTLLSGSYTGAGNALCKIKLYFAVV